MKFIFKILIILMTTFTISCSYENNEESNRLFDKILEGTKDQGQFIGGAWVGDVGGNSSAMLKNGKKINDDYEKILRLRYQIVYPLTGKSDIVDETFTIKNLSLHSKDTSVMDFVNSEKYANLFIKGEFESLKVSMNNGPIENGVGEGRITFAIDSLSKKLKYRMSGTGNYSYYGDIDLNPKNHIPIKKIFRDTISTEEEQKILKSYKQLEITSKKLKKIDAFTYKFLLSKKDILKNTRIRKKYGKTYYETKINNLFSYEVKNISDKDYHHVRMFRFAPWGGYYQSDEYNRDAINNFMDGSSLDSSEYFGKSYDDENPQFKKGKSYRFNFNLKLDTERLDPYSGYLKYLSLNKSMEEIFNEERFLDILKDVFKDPLISFEGKECIWKRKDGTRCPDFEDFQTKIYFELVD